ncbi:MAG: hypothetical protein AB7Q00_15930 [Phycisphaerales bacterium]
MATKTKEELAAEKAAAEKAAAEKAAAEKAAAEKAAADEAAEKTASKKAAKAKTVELKDKDTGFFDPVTGFQVVRDQQVKLGSTIGNATNEALQSGRLLIVEN